MREIKFRFWDDTLKEMIWPNANFTTMVIRLNGRVTDGSVNMVGTLMQFTGLKDKNGVEVYDGDVIRSESGIFTEPVTLIVHTHDEDWPGTVMATSEDNHCPLWDATPCEVIGNIYENPEILK